MNGVKMIEVWRHFFLKKINFKQRPAWQKRREKEKEKEKEIDIIRQRSYKWGLIKLLD
jgi:hypothetical protein